MEDEYTYFSSDKPNLANASVSLTSKFGGDTITLTTNAQGMLVSLNTIIDLDVQLSSREIRSTEEAREEADALLKNASEIWILRTIGDICNPLCRASVYFS